MKGISYPEDRISGHVILTCNNKYWISVAPKNLWDWLDILKLKLIMMAHYSGHGYSE